MTGKEYIEIAKALPFDLLSIAFGTYLIVSASNSRFFKYQIKTFLKLIFYPLGSFLIFAGIHLIFIRLGFDLLETFKWLYEIISKNIWAISITTGLSYWVFCEWDKSRLDVNTSITFDDDYLFLTVTNSGKRSIICSASIDNLTIVDQEGKTDITPSFSVLNWENGYERKELEPLKSSTIPIVEKTLSDEYLLLIGSGGPMILSESKMYELLINIHHGKTYRKIPMDSIRGKLYFVMTGGTYGIPVKERLRWKSIEE